MKKVILLSGGVDSSTCLGMALQECAPEDVLAVNMFYGQKHDREMQSARDVAKYYGVELIELDLSKIFERSNCSLLSHSTQKIEHGSYAEQIKETKGNKPVSTYVPFRNGLFLSSAASIALSHGCAEIWYGAHADDAAGNAYPDTSVAFNRAISEAIRIGSGEELRVVAPFIDKTLCFVPLCLYYGFIGDNAAIKPKMIGEQRITVCLTP